MVSQKTIRNKSTSNRREEEKKLRTFSINKAGHGKLTGRKITSAKRNSHVGQN